MNLRPPVTRALALAALAAIFDVAIAVIFREMVDDDDAAVTAVLAAWAVVWVLVVGSAGGFEGISNRSLVAALSGTGALVAAFLAVNATGTTESGDRGPYLLVLLVLSFGLAVVVIALWLLAAAVIQALRVSRHAPR
ncbi:MAG: hypothetical protein ACM3S1_04655 [Hyphomicrobiales bacterium]